LKFVNTFVKRKLGRKLKVLPRIIPKALGSSR